MLKKIKELASDSMYYGLSSVISQILSLFLVPFYTNELNPEDYGILNMIMLIVAFLSPIAGLGMDSALFRFYSLSDNLENKKAYFSAAVIFKTIATFFFVLLILPAYPLLNKYIFEGYLTKIHFKLFLLYFFLENFSMLSVIILRSEREVKRIAFINVTSIIIGLVFSIFLVLYLKWKVTGALIAMLATSFYKLVLCTNVSNKNFFFSKPEINISKDLFKYGLPQIPHKIQAHIMSMFTAFIINQKLGIVASGLYAVSSKLAKPLSFIITIVQQSWLPFKFQIHKTDINPARTFKDIISIYFLLIISIWVIISILTPSLFHVLINKKYWSGIKYTPFIMFVSICQGFYFMITTGYELSNKQQLMFQGSFLGMLSLILLSFVIINFFPPYSFIIAQSLTYLILTLIIFPEAKKQIKINYPFKTYAIFFIFSSSNIILFYYFNLYYSIYVHLFLQLVISFFTYIYLYKHHTNTVFFKTLFKKHI
jgi:O-antigen/teichoic acid export membrane protein